ncbi:MAG: haloacid dehalogenase-like hydrolase [Candidatus Woesearchaeota archaeon]|nr:haloacid dehalogenase-like hydrolase [Candidatus Woesearchaeota archaeon]
MQLDYLVKPSKSNDRSFVLSNSSKKDIRERIRKSSYVVSDLDYTLIDSPTLGLVVRRFFEGGFLDIRQDIWAVKAVFQYLLHGKNAAPPMWSEYRDKFKCEFRHYIESHKPALSFYPGVQEFFRSLPETTEKMMVTRTFHEIAKPFADCLGFGECHSFEDDKVLPFLEGIIHSSYDVLIGDSKEDENIVTALKKRSTHPLTIYVASSPNRINENFEINIGRDYRGLNKIINSD